MEAELPPPHTLPATTTERELDEPRIIADNPGVDVPGIIHVKTYEPGWREHINNAKEFARKHHKKLVIASLVGSVAAGTIALFIAKSNAVEHILKEHPEADITDKETRDLDFDL